MTVRSSDGQDLGRVGQVDEAAFEIQDSERLPALSYAEVSHVEGDVVVIVLSRAEIVSGVHAGGQIRAEPGAPELGGGAPTVRPTPDALREDERRS